ncbi:MAG TPA: hypothetical protein VER79_12520 [Candidatus Limnocylindrales bacterium]|nr:hypothetical protein [Candidatus Limnocylindrales bacterium]
MKRRLIPLLALASLLLAACSGGGGAGSDAAKVVEQYLTAKIAGDRDAMAPLICAALEPTLDLEASSFSAVQAQIEGMNCTFDEAASTVTCAGEIKAEYGLETRSFPLSTYAVVQEDGAWRWCGEAAG